MTLIRRIPVPFAAIGLALAALGNLLMPYSESIRAACGIASAAVIGLVLLRIALDFTAVVDELKTPPALAVFPTLFMALMLLATYLKSIAAQPAKVLWLVALVAQLAIVAVFLVRFVVGFKLPTVLPSWFLVFVGFVVASVTSPAFEMQPLGRVLLLAGLAGYVVALVLVVTCLVKLGPLPAPALPTLAIFAAPPSLILVGYLAVAESKQQPVVLALLAVAAASLLFVLASLPKILATPFAPSYSALTFPIVITAIAAKQSAAFLNMMPALKPVVSAIDVFATAMVLYALARYIVFLSAAPAVVVAPEPTEA